MNYTGKYLKPGKRVTTPGVVFSVTVSTDTSSVVLDGRYTERRFKRAAATVSTKSRGMWTKPRAAQFDSWESLHNWIRCFGARRKRNYIICPCASNVLTLTHWWEYAEEHGILFTDDKRILASVDGNPTLASMLCISRICLRGKPDILSYRHFGKSYMWVSSSQYFDISEDILSDSLERVIPGEYRGLRNSTCGRERLIYQAVLLNTAFTALSDWWSNNAKAPFGLTVGSLAMGVLRSHVPKKALCSHTDTTAHRLERIACYGGRASVWYVGNIGNGVVDTQGKVNDSGGPKIPTEEGPITHIDIRSMYPTILRDSSFPCRYVKRTGPITSQQWKELSTYYATIAHVRVKINNAEYPMRKDSNVLYPRGVFQTVLTGADLESFEEGDEIQEIYECILYISQPVFRDAANFLLQQRIEARNSGDYAWELFAKTLGNSMGGKLAQRRGNWVDRRDMCAKQQWGEWYEYNADSQICRKFRAIAGMVSEYIKDESGGGPFTASFAYLTAYGRQLMRRIRAAFDSETVVSQDTDGLWVLGELPYSKLADVCSFGDNPGQLDIKEVSKNGRFWGPKHYYVDSGWILSGFHDYETPLTNGDIVDYYNDNPIWNGVCSLPTTIKTRQRISRAVVGHDTSGISPYGWICDKYISPVDEKGNPLC